MMYIVELTEQAEKDLDAHIKAGNKTLLEKIARLIGELEVHRKPERESLSAEVMIKQGYGHAN